MPKKKEAPAVEVVEPVITGEKQRLIDLLQDLQELKVDRVSQLEVLIANAPE